MNEYCRLLSSRDSIVVWFFRSFAANRRRFAALAETARVARERDEARARILELESELAALRATPRG